MHMTKRLLPVVVLGASVALAATHGSTMVRAQGYPTKNITVIIPFAGGSASDVVARILFDRMSKNMGQTIIVENRPGAGGNSGTGAAAKATPDGYTLVGGGSGPVAAGDTVRWIIGDTESGTAAAKKVHILVKPTRPELVTNLGASCKTVGRGVLETSYDVNRTRHV